ncbi:MAG: hypothetical protein JST54_27535 [Deltaproteobacteria bacterium]|nr:hypothetical protein [Deltaproteobacteria bacterium]
MPWVYDTFVRRALWLSIWLLPAAAQAHPLDVAYLEIQADGDVVTATIDLGVPVALEASRLGADSDLSPAGISKAAPALFAGTIGSGVLEVEGQACRWGEPVAAIDGIRIRIRAAARCADAPGRLHYTLPFVESTAPTFRLLGQARLQGQKRDFQLGPGREVVSLDGPAPSTAPQLVRGAFQLADGVGLLALLGALALALAGRERLAAVMALALAVLAGSLLGRFVPLSPRPLQWAAVLGGVALALESAWIREPTRRWRFAAPIGLVLGLALAPSLPGMAALGGLGVALLLACALALGLGRLLKSGRLSQLATLLVLLGTLAASVDALR